MNRKQFLSTLSAAGLALRLGLVLCFLLALAFGLAVAGRGGVLVLAQRHSLAGAAGVAGGGRRGHLAADAQAQAAGR